MCVPWMVTPDGRILKQCVCAPGHCSIYQGPVAYNRYYCVKDPRIPLGCDIDTHDSCYALDCSYSYGNTTCGKGYRCECAEGTCFVNGTCMPHNETGVEPMTCDMDTGGSCEYFACDESRGAECIGELCLCPPGKCAVDGKCEPASSFFLASESDGVATADPAAGSLVADDTVRKRNTSVGRKRPAPAHDGNRSARLMSASPRRNVAIPAAPVETASHAANLPSLRAAQRLARGFSPHQT